MATVTEPLRRAHTVELPPEVRSHLRDVVRWALATGRPVGRDALAAVIGARVQACGDIRSRWTTEDVGALLWVGIADWCERQGAALPEGTRDTLTTYLRYLGARRMVLPGSDPAAVLRRAVVEYGGTPARSANHPAGRGRAPVLPIG